MDNLAFTCSTCHGLRWEILFDWPFLKNPGKLPEISQKFQFAGSWDRPFYCKMQPDDGSTWIPKNLTVIWTYIFIPFSETWKMTAVARLPIAMETCLLMPISSLLPHLEAVPVVVAQVATPEMAMVHLQTVENKLTKTHLNVKNNK